MSQFMVAPARAINYLRLVNIDWKPDVRFAAVEAVNIVCDMSVGNDVGLAVWI
jgi:hypothetical protein